MRARPVHCPRQSCDRVAAVDHEACREGKHRGPRGQVTRVNQSASPDAAVIASAAKQSPPKYAPGGACFAAVAMTAKLASPTRASDCRAPNGRGEEAPSTARAAAVITS